MHIPLVHARIGYIRKSYHNSSSEQNSGHERCSNQTTFLGKHTRALEMMP
jgi:hypothetical protein